MKNLVKLLFLFSTVVFSSTIGFKGNLYKQIYAYEKEHKKFSRQICTPGIDFKYYKLLRDYRGDGIYIPRVNNRIDRLAISKNLKYISKKRSYIKSILKKLRKNKKLLPIKVNIKSIEKQIDSLLEFKLNKKKVGVKLQLKKLEKSYDALIDKIYYLKSYGYPNDHLANRVEYDSYLGLKSTSAINKKNQVYFYRKIIEDGAFDKDHKRSDIYTRSTLDTIKKVFQEEPTQLTENLRYDLEWALKRVQSKTERSTKKQIERMTEWYARTSKLEKYYKRILKMSSKEEKKILKNKDKATKLLKDFVYRKQAQTFKYWKNKKDILKILFVLETTLFNEVGTVDGEDALERQDVVKIVLNRFKNPKYNWISKRQEIAKYLKPKDYENEKVLGTLFKRGEFSFTYYYISSVVKIFCPDMTRVGKKLRSKNLKISLKELKNYKYDFTPARYFSRVSMFGKVDMAKVWTDYEKFPQRPGLIYPNQGRLYRKFKRKKFRYLYDFIDPRGYLYSVIEISNKNYSVKNMMTKPVFFKYRSPHLFTYFLKK